MSGIRSGDWVVSENPLHADNGVGVVQQVRGEQVEGLAFPILPVQEGM